jgi:type VI secretion system protein ImpH
MGKFRIQLGPLAGDQFQTFLPDQPALQKLHFLTRFYLNDFLDYDLELVLAAGEPEKISLGAPRWARLGWDTWVFSDKIGEQKSARFPLPKD